MADVHRTTYQNRREEYHPEDAVHVTLTDSLLKGIKRSTFMDILTYDMECNARIDPSETVTTMSYTSKGGAYVKFKSQKLLQACYQAWEHASSTDQSKFRPSLLTENKTAKKMKEDEESHTDIQKTFFPRNALQVRLTDQLLEDIMEATFLAIVLHDMTQNLKMDPAENVQDVIYSGQGLGYVLFNTKEQRIQCYKTWKREYKEGKSKLKPRKVKTYRKCEVCGDTDCPRIAGYYGGQDSCDACRSFFYKDIKFNRKWVCQSAKPCEVIKETRKKCRRCRHLKCLQIGMDEDLVRQEMNKEQSGDNTP